MSDQMSQAQEGNRSSSEEGNRLSSAPLLPSQPVAGEKEVSPITEMATVDVSPAPAPAPAASAGRAPMVQQSSQDSTGGARVNRELVPW